MNIKYIILLIIFCNVSHSYGMHQLIPIAEKAIEVAWDGYMTFEGVNSCRQGYEHWQEAHNRTPDFESNTKIDLSMIQELNSSHILGLDLGSYHNDLANQLMKEMPSDTVFCQPASSHFAAVETERDLSLPRENVEVSAHNVTDVHENTFSNNHDVISPADDISHKSVTIDNFRFSDSVAYDNRHAVYGENDKCYQPVGHRQNFVPSWQKNSYYKFAVGKNISEKQFLNLVLSKSDTGKAVSSQIALCLGKWASSESKLKISKEVNTQLRQFFYKKGPNERVYFNGINSNERQGQLLKILAPSIKEYYQRTGDLKGYADFLNDYAQKGIEEARYLHGLEINGKDIIDHFEIAGNSAADYLGNFFTYIPEIFEIEYRSFVQDFGKLDSLCRTGKMEEAQAFLQEHAKTQDNYNGTNLKSEVAEYDILCKVYENYKVEAQEALQKNSLASVVIAKKTDTEIVNNKASQVKADNAEGVQQNGVQKTIESKMVSPQGPNLNDPENEKSDRNKTNSIDKISLKETKTYKDAYDQVQKSTEKFEKLGLKPISRKDLKHIVNEHTHAGSKTTGTSQFIRDENFIEHALEGWEKGTWIDKNSKIYDTGRVIGHDCNGVARTSIKICLNGTGDAIRTVFPV